MKQFHHQELFGQVLAVIQNIGQVFHDISPSFAFYSDWQESLNDVYAYKNQEVYGAGICE